MQYWDSQGEFMKNRPITILLILFAMLIFIAACASATPAATAPASSSTLDGATLLQERCSVCHPLTFVERSRHTAADWKIIVDMMISRGAQLTSDEEGAVVSWLAANYGQ